MWDYLFPKKYRSCKRHFQHLGHRHLLISFWQSFPVSCAGCFLMVPLLDFQLQFLFKQYEAKKLCWLRSGSLCYHQVPCNTDGMPSRWIELDCLGPRWSNRLSSRNSAAVVRPGFVNEIWETSDSCSTSCLPRTAIWETVKRPLPIGSKMDYRLMEAGCNGTRHHQCAATIAFR